MSGPIEVKVSAAAIASALTGLGLWALQVYVFRGEVPLPVLAAVQTVIPALVTFFAGYLAPHTPRPSLRAVAGAHALDGDLPDPPPQHGAGSSKTAWADYASAAGVDVGAHASRDDIIAACQAAHVPTD